MINFKKKALFPRIKEKKDNLSLYLLTHSEKKVTLQRIFEHPLTNYSNEKFGVKYKPPVILNVISEKKQTRINEKEYKNINVCVNKKLN